MPERLGLVWPYVNSAESDDDNFSGFVQDELPDVCVVHHNEQALPVLLLRAPCLLLVSDLLPDPQLSTRPQYAGLYIFLNRYDNTQTIKGP